MSLTDDDRKQLDLFGMTPSSPLLKKIEELDEKMEQAIAESKFDEARQLAREQERLLSDLMKCE
jgi:hypothetical protein